MTDTLNELTKRVADAIDQRFHDMGFEADPRNDQLWHKGVSIEIAKAAIAGVKKRGEIPVKKGNIFEPGGIPLIREYLPFIPGDTHCEDCPCRYGQHLREPKREIVKPWWDAETIPAEIAKYQKVMVSVKYLLTQWRAYKETYQNQEEAYYKLAKYAYQYWVSLEKSVAELEIIKIETKA